VDGSEQGELDEIVAGWAARRFCGLGRERLKHGGWEGQLGQLHDKDGVLGRHVMLRAQLLEIWCL
jgi:hypothetical protein